MSMALGFHATAAPPLFHHLGLDAGPDMSDVDPEVTDALLGFVYDPLDPSVNAGLDEFLSTPLLGDCGDDDGQLDQQRPVKKPRAGRFEDDAWFDFTAGDGSISLSHSQQPWSNGGAPRVPLLPEFLTEFVLPLPPPTPPPLQVYPAFVRGADVAKKHDAGNGCQHSGQSATARQRRKRISEKTAELSRLIPGGHKLNTAEMLQEAARHVKLLQAQVGMLALLQTIEDKVPAMAQQQMHALLVCGGVQERLAAEGKCLVPRKLVHAVAGDAAVKSNALVNRELSRFVESLPPEQ